MEVEAKQSEAKQGKVRPRHIYLPPSRWAQARDGREQGGGDCDGS